MWVKRRAIFLCKRKLLQLVNAGTMRHVLSFQHRVALNIFGWAMLTTSQALHFLSAGAVCEPL